MNIVDAHLIFQIFQIYCKNKKKWSQKENTKIFQCRSILIHFFFLPWKFQLDRTIISRGWNFHFWFFENDPPEPPSGTPHEKFLKISFLPKSSKLWFRKSQELSGGVYLNFFWEKSKKREGGADSAPLAFIGLILNVVQQIQRCSLVSQIFFIIKWKDETFSYSIRPLTSFSLSLNKA